MVLHIKNMVCDRCIMVVRQQLEHAGFSVPNIMLGTAEITPDATDSDLIQIASSLKLYGFELINNEKDRIIEQIKNIVITQVHHADQSSPTNVNFSTLITSALNKDYSYLSRLFSEAEDVTLAKFIIQQKVEKIKELLQDGQLNLNEIAWNMGYSSSAHLSSQFKQVTGITPSQYKLQPSVNRKPLDKV